MIDWLRAHRWKCQLLVYPKQTWCGAPAVACVVLFGEHKLVCAFHAWDGKEDAFPMLARTLMEAKHD